MSSPSNTRQLPPPLISVLEDGTVEINVGGLKGWVSSMHLIEPKVNQLNQAYINVVS
jgi:hypothetical protein